MNDCLVQPIESRVATKPGVLFVTPRFHPYPGGYENYVAWLAKSLRKTGARVSVFTTTAFDLESFWLRGRRTLPPGPEFWEGIEVRRFEIATGDGCGVREGC